MKIYVASSWRNDQQPMIVAALRKAGHEVYDFRNPSDTDKGFAWSDIDPDWQLWTNEQYRKALEHPIALKGFMNDFKGMMWADACVMVMPCGRSAHTEAGWMQGQGKPTIILQPKEAEPELMYKIYELVTDSLEEVIHHLKIIDMAEKLDQALGE
jgi:nucleoside 2-deoxyribosyltransferase